MHTIPHMENHGNQTKISIMEIPRGFHFPWLDHKTTTQPQTGQQEGPIAAKASPEHNNDKEIIPMFFDVNQSSKQKNIWARSMHCEPERAPVAVSEIKEQILQVDANHRFRKVWGNKAHASLLVIGLDNTTGVGWVRANALQAMENLYVRTISLAEDGKEHQEHKHDPGTNQEPKPTKTWGPGGTAEEMGAVVVIVDYTCLDAKSFEQGGKFGPGLIPEIMPHFFKQGKAKDRKTGKLVFLPNDRWGSVATQLKEHYRDYRAVAGCVFLSLNQCRKYHPLMRATWAAQQDVLAWNTTIDQADQALQTNERALSSGLHGQFPSVLMYNRAVFSSPGEVLDYIDTSYTKSNWVVR